MKKSHFDILDAVIGDYLQEALSDDDKAVVKKWRKGSNAFSDSFFGGSDKDKNTYQRRYFDFEPDEVPPAMKDVESHLKKHGYTISDHKKGLAKDSIGREVRIGKVLGRTGTPDLLKQYNDAKANQSDDGLKILISRHPDDVAGMTSPGHSWCGPGGSCMNFHHGSNRRFLPKDLKHGTHVAYLVEPGDEEHPQRPLARIAIKRFSNGDTHLLGVERVYGNAPKGFKQQVQDILDREHNQNQPVGLYRKHDEIYDDTREPEKFHIGKDVNAALSHPSWKIRHQAFESGEGITPEHIAKGLQDPSAHVQNAAIARPEATPEQNLHVLRHKGYDAEAALRVIEKDNLTSDHIEAGLEHSDAFVRGKSAAHKNATFEQFERGFNSKDPLVRAEAIKSHHAQDHHIEAALKDQDPSVQLAAAQHANAKAHHLDFAYDNGKRLSLRLAAVNNKNASDDLISKGLDDKDFNVQLAAASHVNAKAHHLDKAISSNDIELRKAAYENPNLQSSHVDRAFEEYEKAKNSSDSIGYWAAKRATDIVTALAHPTAVKDHHLDKALTSQNARVRKAALNSPAAGEEFLTKFLNTQHHFEDHAVHDLMTTALEHPKLKSHHLDIIFDDSKFHPAHQSTVMAREAALKHKKLKSHHIDKAIESNNSKLIDAVLDRRDLKAHHIENILRAGPNNQKAVNHPSFQKTDVDTLLSFTHSHLGPARSLIFQKHSGIQDHHLTAELSDPESHYGIKSKILKRKDLKPHHIQIAGQDRDWAIRSAAAAHSLASQEHLDAAVNDADYRVVASVMRNKKAKAHHIAKGLQDQNKLVQQAAFESGHKSITSEHISNAIKGVDQDDSHASLHTALTALRHKNVSSQNLHDALNSKSHTLGQAVVSHKNAQADHLERILTDRDRFDNKTRATALKHKNASRAQLERAANDETEHYEVRRVARDRLSKQPPIKQQNEAFDNAISQLIEARYETAHENAWINSIKAHDTSDTISKCIDLFTLTLLRRPL